MERSVFACVGGISNTFSYTIGQPIIGYSIDSFGCNIGFQHNLNMKNISVNDNIFENELKVYPNPAIANQDIQIHSKIKASTSLKIFDSTGKLLSSESFSSGVPISFKAPALPGVYSILVNNYCYRLVVLN